MSYILRGHPGSGDHGWEDRVRGTCALVGDLEICSARPDQDWHYGLGKLAALRREHCRPRLVLVRERKISVLWDWTGSPPEDCSRFHRISVPDRRTLSHLQNAGLDKKAQLGPDPLFLVEHPRPDGKEQEPVGLCGCPALPYPYCRALIQGILRQTHRPIAMIPYRAEDPGMQRILTKGLHGDRLIFVPDGPSPVLRSGLSRCACVIGTPAAVMAAWSCGVPGLCIGFSPRAVGLATELFGSWQEAVIPIASLKTAEDLLLAVRCFLSLTDRQRKALETAVPRRREQSRNWNLLELVR